MFQKQPISRYTLGGLEGCNPSKKHILYAMVRALCARTIA